MLGGLAWGGLMAQPTESGRLSGEDLEARVEWRDPRTGDRGMGTPRQVTVDTTAFSFFDPDNLEVVVKALDAGSVNGHLWVFFTALTDLQLAVEVHDPRSLLTRRYLRPAGTGGPVQDVQAFPQAWREDDLTGEHWLWIGAHPDDEVLAAPWLELVCRRWGARCTFLVVTRGEAGSCLAPEGCEGDLATVRSQEMTAAASLYGAGLVLWRWPDGAAGRPAEVAVAWSEAAGGSGAVGALADFLRDRQPDRVLTLDPRHGSTCHPDHRALGSLVTRAVQRVEPRPALQVVASRAVFEDGLPVGFVPAAAVDSERRLEVPATGATDREDQRWQALLATAALHESQFPPTWLDALAGAAPERRRIELRSVDGPEGFSPSCLSP